MSSTALSLAQLTQGFILSREAQGASPRTVEAYELAFRSLETFLDAPQLADIRTLTSTDLERWAVGLRERGLSTASRDQRVAKLKTLFRWAHAEGFLAADLGAGLKRPRKDWQPEPFTPDEVRRLLAASRAGRCGIRDYAILSVLLDSGLRASELCALRPTDVNLRTGTVRVAHGKGGRSRVVLIGRSARDALWRWSVVRPPTAVPLFVTEQGAELSRSRLAVMVRAIGQRAGVPNCHTHRTRHTFSVQFLRSGGNAFALQHLLGHSSLAATQEYIRIAEADLVSMYRSPLDALATQ